MPRKKGDLPLTLPEIEKAKALAAIGKSYRQIGVELHRSDHTIKRLLTVPDVAAEVSDKKAELADMFEDLAKRMVGSISDEDIRKLDAYRRTLSGGIAVDKMQLLRGQPTSINFTLLADFVAHLRAQRERGESSFAGKLCTGLMRDEAGGGQKGGAGGVNLSMLRPLVPTKRLVEIRCPKSVHSVSKTK